MPSTAGPNITTTISASKTRPNNTTTYTSGDVWNESASAGTVLTFANAARYAGGSGFIYGAVLVDSANVATKPQLELWLFSVAPTADNDNATFTPTDTELESLIGIIPFGSTYQGDIQSDAAGNSVQLANSVALTFRAVAADIYGVLVVRNAYVPVAQEKLTVLLKLSQD